MTAPTVVILAAGQGTRMRSAHAEGPARPLRAPDGRVAGRRRARGRRRRRSSWSAAPTGALEGHLPEGVELAVQPEPNGTGGAVRAAAGQLDAGPPVARRSPATCRSSPPTRSASSSRPTRRAAPPATMATTELDDPTRLRPRRARRRRRASSASSRPRSPGDATPEELAIREVNTGIYAFDGGALLDALERLARRQRAGRALPARRAAAAARRGRDGRAPTSSTTRRSCSASTTASSSREVRALAQRRIHERHMRAGVDDRRPGVARSSTPTSTIGADTVVEPSTLPARRHPRRRRCRIGPADHADRRRRSATT